MVDKNLEEKQDPKEPTEEVSEKEEPKQVSQVEKKVSGDTEETFTKAQVEEQKVGYKEELHRDWQSVKDRELQPLKDKIAELEKTSQDSSWATQEAKEVEDMGDTAEVRDFQTKRREQHTLGTTLSQRETDITVKEQRLWEDAKVIGAHKLAKDKEVDVNELLNAKTPEEMETMAVKLENQRLKEKLEEKVPEKIDSDVVTTGVDTSPESAKGKIRAGWDELHKS